MKTTAKEFNTNKDLAKLLNQWKNEATDKENFESANELSKQILELNSTYFDKLEKVNVRFCIGSRAYYESVTKVGNKFYSDGRSMTKENGFWNVVQIAVITEKMTANMLSDSHYY